MAAESIDVSRGIPAVYENRTRNIVVHFVRIRKRNVAHRHNPWAPALLTRASAVHSRSPERVERKQRPNVAGVMSGLATGPLPLEGW